MNIVNMYFSINLFLKIFNQREIKNFYKHI